jgi:hypothetical protein
MSKYYKRSAARMTDKAGYILFYKKMVNRMYEKISGREF